MMPSTTNGNSNYNHKSKVNIPVWLAKAPAILFWLLVWQAASMKLEQEILLASPVSVLKKLGELVCTGDFWRSAAFSCGRIGAGFVLALALGIVLAVLAHRFWVAAALLTPLMTVIKSTPVASFIILCLIWIPSKNLSVFISFLMVLPVVYTNLLTGIGQTDRKLLEMADVFSVPLRKRVFTIYLSQVLPYLVTACTLGLGLCWKAGVAAEVIGVPSGSIGEKLYHAKVYLNTPDLFAWTIVIIAISFLFEKCFLWLLGRLEERIERM